MLMNTVARSKRGGPGRLRTVAALALALVAGTHTGRAQPRAAEEADLKAAFVLSFARYTTWPTNAFTNVTAPVVFGVLGRNPVETEIERVLRGQTVGDRHVQFVRYDSLARATNCHVLFLGESQRARLEEVFVSLRNRPILTVGDMQPFAARGGMLGFIRRDSRLSFEANPAAIRRAGLTVSSRLLQLATIVETRPP